MHISRYLRRIDIPGINQFRYLLRSSNIETGQLCEGFYKYHDHLSPLETLRVAHLFFGVVRESIPCHLSDKELGTINRLLIDDIRKKLYTLTEPHELCRVAIDVANYEIAGREFVSDFLSRLENLLFKTKIEHVSTVCQSLTGFHIRGYNVEHVARKFFSYLVSRGIPKKLEFYDLTKLLRCLGALNVVNGSLSLQIASKMKTILRSEKALTVQMAADLLDMYKPRFPESNVIHRLLMERIAQADVIAIESLASCLAVCAFPVEVMDKIDQLVIAGIKDASFQTRLKILNAYSNFHYKPAHVIDPLLSAIKTQLELPCKFSYLAQCLFDLFRLNINDMVIINHIIALLREKNQTFSRSNAKDICEILLALCYFGVSDGEIYEKLILELIRFGCALTPQSIAQLQAIEILTCNGMIKGFEQLRAAARNFLLEISHRDVSAYSVQTCPLQEEVGKTATFVSHTLYKQVKVGPYAVDFLKPLTGSEIANMSSANNRIPKSRDPSCESHLGACTLLLLSLFMLLLAEMLLHVAVVLQVDDAKQFYRNSTERLDLIYNLRFNRICRTSQSRLKLLILEKLRYRCVHVPYLEWRTLKSWPEKRRYLADILRKTVPSDQQPLA